MKNQEIELKYLVKTPLKFDISQYQGKHILQGFIIDANLKIDESTSSIIIDNNVIDISQEQLNKLIDFNHFGEIDLSKDVFRIRQITYHDGKAINLLTLKSLPTNRGLSRTEIECEISQSQFDRLLPFCKNNIIKKIRYIINFEEFENTVLELDIFCGRHNGLVLAEFEFETLEEARNFLPPAILDCTDVTGDKKYTNWELSKM